MRVVGAFMAFNIDWCDVEIVWEDVGSSLRYAYCVLFNYYF